MVERVTEKVVARAKAIPILKKLPVFEGLMEGELSKILSLSSSAALAAGETLFNQGDDASSMYILLSGELDIAVDGLSVHVMKPGEIVGEIGLVCDVSRTASAVARKDSILLHLYAKIFHELVPTHPRIGYVIMRNVARILGARVIETNDALGKCHERR